MENTFAATLPLESMTYILSQFQSRRSTSQLAQEEREIIVLDVSRAPKIDGLKTASQDTWDNCFEGCTEFETQTTFGSNIATTLQLIEDTILDYHHHAWRFFLMETLRCFFIWRASDGLKRVRIPKRGAKLGGDGVWTTTNMWRSWTYWWIFRDVGGERVVTLEPHPRHVDLLKITCRLNAKSQAVTSLKAQKIDTYDETLLSVGEATAFRKATMRLAFVEASQFSFSC